MTASDLLKTCRDRGVTLAVEGDRIHAVGPLDTALVAELREHKCELLEQLRPAPAAPWPKDREPIPADDPADPYHQWLAGVTVQNDGIKTVRCLDCRHCEPNEHTPLQGWCSCAVNCHRDHGWPAARRLCRRFQEKDGGHA